jgi:hypothetical protein
VAGKSAGFAIGIGINDGASAGLDAINRRIAAMHAPAERFNKSMAKFGEVTGINRAAEGLQTMGDRALGAARAVERMAGPMLSLSSLASLGGMVAMTRQWANAGNEISKTSNLLNTPVSRLSALRGAARLAGSSAEAMDSSLKGLGDTLATAKFRGGPVVPLLNEMHIGFQGVGKEARTGADALGDVAEAVSKFKDPHAQVRLLQQLGISEDLLPLLQKGRKGLEEFLVTSQRTGGVMTAEMAANAKKMNSSWNELALAIEGVGNRIVDSWSGTATKVLDQTAHWIEQNQAQADSYGKIGTEVGLLIAGLAARKPAMWILRALGWEPLLVAAVAEGASRLPPANFQTGENTTSLLTPGGIAPGSLWGVPRTMSDDPSQPDYRAPEGPSWWQRALGVIRGGERRPSAGDFNRSIIGPRAGDTSGNALDSGTAARAKQVHDGLVSRGMDSNTAWGFAGNAVQESRAMWNSNPGDGGAAHGLMMWRDSADGGRRYSDYVGRWGHAPEQGSLNEALDNIVAELKGPEARAWTNIQRAGNTPGEKGAVISTYYERPKDTAAEESRRWGLAQRLAGMFPDGSPGGPAAPAGPLAEPSGPTKNLMAAPGANGSVQVDITLHGAPHGTTATVVSSGSASASPLRIETSMPQAR